jgi:hypothetical protein
MAELWSGETLERIAQAGRRVRGLRELTSTFLPRNEPFTAGHGDWPLIGFAMLARSCAIAESAIALAAERRAVDAGVLTRALFEQVLTFAWIAIQPDVNADGWVRWDRQQRIKADNDLCDLGADPLLEPAVRRKFEEFIAGGEAMPDQLPLRAKQADAHWAPRIEAISAEPTSTRSFRGMYRILYRGDSRFTHAAVASIEPLIIGAGDPGHRTVLPVETDPGARNPFTRSPMIYSLGLLVAEPALGLAGMMQAIDTVFAG